MPKDCKLRCQYLLILLFALLSGPVLAGQQSEANDWIIVPGKRVGPITGSTTEEKLGEIFGERNVRRENIPLGEGETEPGTVVFPFSDNRLAILWADHTRRERPNKIRLNGDKSAWKTSRGISLGTSLKDLAKLNGRPFALSGFAWDLAGTVVDCNNGRLREVGCSDSKDPEKKLRGRTLLLRLSPLKSTEQMTDLEKKHYDAVLGEAARSSSHPAMQTLNPRVYEMVIWFERQNY